MRNLYKRLSLTMGLLLMIASVVLAQQRIVTGTVTDETGTGMPGVNVLVKGTSTGTVTDVNGKYSINVPGDDAILTYTFVGYKTSEVAVGSRTTVDMPLEVDIASLEEVVVTGYGVDKRRELTGAVSTVKTRDLTVAPSGNVEQMLQGRVPGVTVITNGQPGTNSQIRIRGFGSFDNNQPLYIVDGVPTQNINFLNPDDIETTTVLKDAAAASIYGARAASGVVVYTTRKGKKGQRLNVTYDGLFGFTDPGKGIDMMNPQDFATWTWNAQKNTAFQNGADFQTQITKFNHPQFGTGLTPKIPEYLMVGGTTGAAVTGNVDLAAEKLKYNIDPRNGSIYQVVRSNQSGTDWYDEITRTAPIYRQTLGFNGSGENSRYYVGLSAQDQDGILIANSLKRYALRVNSEFDVRPNIRVGENLQFTYRSVVGQNGGNNGQGVAQEENDILAAFRMPSIIPVYDVFGGYAGTAAKGFNNPRNPVASRMGQVNNKAFGGGAFGNIYLEWDPIPGLTLRTSVGGNYGGSFSRGYNRWQYENSENNSAFQFNQASAYFFAWTFTNTATYKKSIGSSNFEVLIGQEALNDGSGWETTQSGLNPFSWDPDFISMSNTTPNPAQSTQFTGRNFSSLFGQIKYSFKEKYILSAVVRRDGASVFGPTNKFGVFPAASAAWRISAENFMQSLTFISDLKIRGGYGVMGNSNNVPSTNQFFLNGGSVANSSYDINGSNSSAVTGFYRTTIGNVDAKWETSETMNIGIDGQFFGGKLDIVLDIWKKNTKDLLLVVPLSAVVGYNAQPPVRNVATMLNQGIDLSIGSKGTLTSGLNYELTLNGSWLKNEITAVAPGQTYLTTVNPNYRGITPIRNQLGHTLSAFYGYDVQGIFQNQAEVDAAATQDGKAIGRFRYRDINGDGNITPDDRTYLGSPIPKFTGGFNFKLLYKGFDLEAYMYTSLGNKIFNQSKWFTDFYPSFQGAAISERVKDSWTPENPDATIPMFESASNFSTNTQSSSFYIEDGSFLRLQNLTLGYNIPMSFLDKIKFTKLRVYIAANNLFTITNYSGLDPSVGGAVDTTFGVDIGNYPLTKSYTAGISIGF
jgi:TonB-dependent starch-binding outer membrane protein SusC